MTMHRWIAGMAFLLLPAVVFAQDPAVSIRGLTITPARIPAGMAAGRAYLDASFTTTVTKKQRSAKLRAACVVGEHVVVDEQRADSGMFGPGEKAMKKTFFFSYGLPAAPNSCSFTLLGDDGFLGGFCWQGSEVEPEACPPAAAAAAAAQGAAISVGDVKLAARKKGIGAAKDKYVVSLQLLETHHQQPKEGKDLEIAMTCEVGGKQLTFAEDVAKATTLPSLEPGQSRLLGVSAFSREPLDVAPSKCEATLRYLDRELARYCLEGNEAKPCGAVAPAAVAPEVTKPAATPARKVAPVRRLPKKGLRGKTR